MYDNYLTFMTARDTNLIPMMTELIFGETIFYGRPLGDSKVTLSMYTY